MNPCKEAGYNIHYARELLNAGLEGARSGREKFLKGKRLGTFLAESFSNTLKPAALGLCLGLLGSYRGNGRKKAGRVFARGLIGGAVGFGAGAVWQSRFLVETAAGSALKSIGRVRDDHWLKRNPIDYA
jgi:hypothetical protein